MMIKVIIVMYDGKEIMVVIEVTIEVDTVDANMANKPLIETIKIKNFSHLFVIDDSVSEEEVDFNHEVTCLKLNVISATRLVISAMNIDQLL